MADEAIEVPAALRAAYHARCDEEGVSLAAFLEEVRGAHPVADLLALVEVVEADVLENILMMAQTRPDLEVVAEARAAAVRREMVALRATLEGEG